MTRAQEQALATYWRDYGIEFSRSALDIGSVFGRAGAPLVIDIGPGMGATTTTLAQSRPDYNYLSVEVHTPGIGSLLRLAGKYGLSNIRVISHDAIEVIRHMLPANSLSQALIFFPDPWPKKRHHKRRLLNPAFASLLLTRLKDHGRVYVSTDWEDYAESIPAVFENSGYVNLAGAGQRSPRPRWRPVTKFERRGAGLGHAVHDFIFTPSNHID